MNASALALISSTLLGLSGLLSCLSEDALSTGPRTPKHEVSSQFNHNTQPPLPEVPEIDELIPLDDVKQLTRVSMALRGFRPTSLEIEQLINGQKSIDALASEYVQDPAFAKTVRNMYAEYLCVSVLEII